MIKFDDFSLPPSLFTEDEMEVQITPLGNSHQSDTEGPLFTAIVNPSLNNTGEGLVDIPVPAECHGTHSHEGDNAVMDAPKNLVDLGCKGEQKAAPASPSRGPALSPGGRLPSGQIVTPVRLRPDSPVLSPTLLRCFNKKSPHPPPDRELPELPTTPSGAASQTPSSCYTPKVVPRYRVAVESPTPVPRMRKGFSLNGSDNSSLRGSLKQQEILRPLLSVQNVDGPRPPIPPRSPRRPEAKAYLEILERGPSAWGSGKSLSLASSHTRTFMSRPPLTSETFISPEALVGNPASKGTQWDGPGLVSGIDVSAEAPRENGEKEDQGGWLRQTRMDVGSRPKRNDSVRPSGVASISRKLSRFDFTITKRDFSNCTSQDPADGSASKQLSGPKTPLAILTNPEDTTTGAFLRPSMLLSTGKGGIMDIENANDPFSSSGPG